MVIKEYTQNLELKTAREVSDLAYYSRLGERFDFGDFLYTGYLDNKLVAIETLRLEEIDKGLILPRFLNIIFHPDIRNSRQTVYFLKSVENLIFKHSYKAIWAYIMNERRDMAILARKFGFKEYERDSESVTLIKKIGE